MEKMQKKALVIGLAFVVILNLFVIGWLVSDLFGKKEEDPKGTVSSTEEITTEEPTTEEPTTEEPTTEAVVIEPGNIHLEETVVDSGEIVQAIEAEKTLLADLDGDGIQEKITLRAEDKPFAYLVYTLHFQIGDLYYGSGAGIEELFNDFYYGIDANSFSLVDLDTSDNYKEIAILSSDIDNTTYYLRYQNGEIIPIGVISHWNGNKLILGDGSVSARDRYDVLQASFVAKTWKLMNADRFHASLEEVIPEYYEFELRPADYKLTLLQDVTFYAEMNGDSDNLITLPAGTKIDIARYYPGEGWIQILYEQDTKAVWWRMVDSLLLPMNIHEYPSIYEYIAGLSTAG